MINMYKVCDWALRPPDLGIEAWIQMPYTWVRKAWTPCPIPYMGQEFGDSEALYMGKKGMDS